jgi:transposase InsO family protein
MGALVVERTATLQTTRSPRERRLLGALASLRDARDGGPPKYTVSDQGSQFQSEYRRWCARHGVKPRFGAVGRYGSIAVIERFVRTLKSEGLRRRTQKL